MASVTLLTPAGESAGDVDLDDATFAIQPNVPVMHQVVTAQLAARRSGTQSTKTRSEVRGGGAKPYRQKGTGNARQGSIRAPHYSGGGVALGPKPRSYAQRTPKKMIRLALRSALSDRANENKVLVVDGWTFDAPRTSDAVAALLASGATEGKVLVVLGSEDIDAERSFRNLTRVQVIRQGELNAYDVLCNEWIVFTKATLPTATDLPSRRATTSNTFETRTRDASPADVNDSASGDEGSASDEEQSSEPQASETTSEGQPE
ncbi:50S ribosomal protein L4 [soil metagenome]